MARPSPPPRAGQEGAPMVKAGPWMAVLKRELKRRHGYFGGWRDSRWGGAALFYKEPPDLAAAKTEVARMQTYDLQGLVALSNGRRTTR